MFRRTQLSRDEPVTFFALERIGNIHNVDYEDVINYVLNVKKSSNIIVYMLFQFKNKMPKSHVLFIVLIAKGELAC